MSTEMSAGYTYGNEPEKLASIVGPDGIRRLVPITDDPVTVVPHIDPAERERRVNGRVERGMSGKEIAQAVAAADERPRVTDSFTVDGRRASIDEADGTARRYAEKQAEVKRKAGSGLIGQGWTS
jgi:hypothetical protein